MTLFLDIAGLAAAYASGKASPDAVLDQVFARIAKTGVAPVWITLVPPERAHAKMAEQRRRRAAGENLPLFGIPFAVKDNMDVAGLPTTAACPDFAYTPTRSATVVERLEAAGAILVGKTNMDQFATGLVGTRSPYGIVSSALSAEHISGGSSSGSAVAVASGLVSFALGTDTAGSGRVPAAFNNIVGLKPSKGVISARGVLPACRSQDCVSILAGSCGDALAVLQAAAAYDPEDPFSRPAPAAAFLPRALPAGFRFGVPDQPLDFFGDDETARLYAEAIARLEELGGVATAFNFTPFTEAARLLYAGPWVAERLAAIEAFAAAKPDAIHPVVRGIILGAAELSAVEAFKGGYRLAELTRAALAEWAKMELMMLPTAGTIYTIAQVLEDPVGLNTNLGAYTNFTNLMDLSAVALPAGFRSDGLPFGITLLGRCFEEGRLAGLADRLHRAWPQATIGATGRPLPPEGRIEPAPAPEKGAVGRQHQALRQSTIRSKRRTGNFYWTRGN